VSLIAATLLLASAPAATPLDRTDPVPPVLREVGVLEHPDGRLPLDLPFADESERAVTLGAYLAPKRPLILTLNYYRCPMLCTLELNGLVEGLAALDRTIGREFDVVTVSIDPKETAALAREKKQAYLAAYGRPAAASGWHFLTGPAASIEALSEAVGFAATYDPVSDQYAHPAVVFLITPDGRISRYLYGLRFEPKTLQLGLTEASEGRIGSAWDRFLLYCYHYDSRQGRYALAAMKLMRVGGIATVLIFGAVLSSLWLKERRRTRAEA
jgi:protein SCO1/2